MRHTKNKLLVNIIQSDSARLKRKEAKGSEFREE
jgi:hypothetical protein